LLEFPEFGPSRCIFGKKSRLCSGDFIDVERPEQPTKFDLVINLKTAKQLGITIPPNILYQATKVIK